MATPSKQTMFQRFFMDRDGHIVLGQIPNVPIIGWLLFRVMEQLFTRHPAAMAFEHISVAFLFCWAYLEITQGVNYFRRLLGVVVVTILVISFFK